MISEAPGQEKFARYQKDGHDTWFGLWIFSAEDLRLDLVEVGPPALKLKLNAPAAKPETVSVQTGDFPYLSPLPGSISRKQPSRRHAHDDRCGRRQD